MIYLLDLFKWNLSPQEILNIPETWADDLITVRTNGMIVQLQTRKKD